MTLIKKPKSPKVNKLKGSDRTFNRGLINRVSREKITAASTIDSNLEYSIPG